MKKIKNLIKRISPVSTACLTLILAINANTASCFILNEPKEPNEIQKFKIFK